MQESAIGIRIMVASNSNRNIGTHLELRAFAGDILNSSWTLPERQKKKLTECDISSVGEHFASTLLKTEI